MTILSSAAFLFAAPAQASDDAQLWTGATANVNLGGSWRLSQEGISRFSDRKNGLYELESNTLVGYALGKGVTVWAGYTHNPQYSDGNATAVERRAREQVTFDGAARIGRGKLSARMRAEQRWRDNATGTAWRLRPYLKYSLPLRSTGKAAFILSSEPFVNLNTTGFQARTGLERVRNLVAISTPLTKAVTLEGGYLNQRSFVRNGKDATAHAASISLSITD